MSLNIDISSVKHKVDRTTSDKRYILQILVLDKYFVYCIHLESSCNDSRIHQHEMEETMPDITAPMPGKIFEVNVAPGDTVTVDQEVVILEAMKMEMPIVAPTNGTVTSVNCHPGDAVQGGDVLVVLD